MYVWKPTPADIERAKEKQAEEDARARGGQGFRAERDNRWTGRLGEWGVAVWLNERGAPWIRYGGLDKLPDVVVAGESVAVKCVNSYASGGFQLHHHAPMPAFHMNRPEPHILFCAYEHPTQTVKVIGGISRSRFRREAEFFRKGDVMESGKPATSDFYRVPATTLLPCEEWLTKLLAWVEERQVA